MSLVDGLLARRRHTLYAPGTPDECRQLIEVGTAEDASGRLNLRAFRVDWSSPERASIRTAEGLPRTTTRVHLSRHDWGSTTEATTQLDPFQVLIAWILFIGCGGVAIAMAVNRSDGKSLVSALLPFGIVAVVALFALIWMYSRAGTRDEATVHDISLAIGASSVDGVLSPQYALRPNWPPPAENSIRARASGSSS
jgi:hypothetical protein